MPSKTFAVSADTTTRTLDNEKSGQGCGQTKHLYVGRHGTSGERNYDSYIKFALDFSDVAKINSATLNIYNDEYDSYGSSGEPGLFPAPSSTDAPQVWLYRLTKAFGVGGHADGQFSTSDWTLPTKTTSGGMRVSMTKGANVLKQIDITAFVRAWAPSNVQGGGKQPNYGLMLWGDSAEAHNGSYWSSKHGNAGERPSITLNYEYGPTKPWVPGDPEPFGSIPSLSTFTGWFGDDRSTDTLQYTDVEIYDAGVNCTFTASNDTVTLTGHGLKAGDVIFFYAVPGGSGVGAFGTPYYVVSSGLTANTFKFSAKSGGTIFNITANGTAQLTKRVATVYGSKASNSDTVNGQSHVPAPIGVSYNAAGKLKNFPVTGTTYRWRMRQTDQENQTSDWTPIQSILVNNTAPVTPTLSPGAGYTTDSLNLLTFKGGAFSDADGDKLMAHQIQLSPYPPNDVRWDDAGSLKWDTGKSYEPYGSTSWEDTYGGTALTAGTYYWRARQWDDRDGVSAWATPVSIVLTQDFGPDPGSYAHVQIDPHAPWRILIRDLYMPNGTTKTAGRAPGNLIAVLEEGKNIGASIVYNSPGEVHFTLLKDDPQVAVIEPKQTHYAVEFYSGDGWQEKYAGVIWDVDATETDVVFKGIDYLGMYDTVIDERYDPLKPNKSYRNNGSYYEQVTIRNVVLDQLNWAKNLADSWVGHISIGYIASMNEKVSVYSTMQPTLSFIAGLLDSHRQGQGIRTRMKVVKTSTGGYQLQIIDNPGITRNDLAMYYGELVQGYRLIVFGQNWANVEHVVGRNKDGVKVTYQTIKGQTFQPSTSVYGRIATVAVMDGVDDSVDLGRRGLQEAMKSAKLGKQIAIGIRTRFLAPLQGWDVCDVFPLQIVDGAIDTRAFGSGYWTAAAAAWEATDIGEQKMVITFLPREDSTAPNPDLLKSQRISPQAEWQLGWQPPDPLKATSKYWLDQTSGKVYVRVDSTGTLIPVTGTA